MCRVYDRAYIYNSSSIHTCVECMIERMYIVVVVVSYIPSDVTGQT